MIFHSFSIDPGRADEGGSWKLWDAVFAPVDHADEHFHGGFAADVVVLVHACPIRLMLIGNSISMGRSIPLALRAGKENFGESCGVRPSWSVEIRSSCHLKAALSAPVRLRLA